MNNVHNFFLHFQFTMAFHCWHLLLNTNLYSLCFSWRVNRTNSLSGFLFVVLLLLHLSFLLPFFFYKHILHFLGTGNIYQYYYCIILCLLFLGNVQNTSKRQKLVAKYCLLMLYATTLQSHRLTGFLHLITFSAST